MPSPTISPSAPLVLAAPAIPCVIRPMQPGDATAMDELHRACLEQTLAARYTAAQIAAWRTGWAAAGFVEALAEGDIMQVAESPAGEVLGYSAHAGPALLGLFVGPAHQHRGLGRRLLIAAMAEAAGRGEPITRLKAALGAERFYLAFGFRPVRLGHDEKCGEIIAFTEMERPAAGAACHVWHSGARTDPVAVKPDTAFGKG